MRCGPNKNVFSNCLQWSYHDKSGRLTFVGRLCQTRGPAALKARSVKSLGAHAISGAVLNQRPQHSAVAICIRQNSDSSRNTQKRK